MKIKKKLVKKLLQERAHYVGMTHSLAKKIKSQGSQLRVAESNELALRADVENMRIRAQDMRTKAQERSELLAKVMTMVARCENPETLLGKLRIALSRETTPPGIRPWEDYC
jgi:SMC interacting uncharacterized protein involved in chromosome segregation